MTVSFDATFVEQQVWAYLTTILKFSDASAAGIMGAWCNESGRGSTTPDPTSIEGIFDESLYLGPKKLAAMSNWGAYGSSIAVSSYYTASDGVTYPGMGMWGITGENVLHLFDVAKAKNKQWYDLDPQLELWKKTYITASYGGLDSGRLSLLSGLKQGGLTASTASAYAYGLIAYGYPLYEATASASAESIYSKYKGKRFTYTGDSGESRLLEDFIEKALSYSGTTEVQWAQKHVGKWYDQGAWCADFVSACAEEVGGILGVLFDGSASAYACAHSVTKYGGVHHTKSGYTPKRGDLFNLSPQHNNAWAQHIGIVLESNGTTFKTIEGNTGGGVVASNTLTISSAYCFCSPNWPASSGSSNGGSGFIASSLFESKNTREDAILREVAYLDKNYKPTTEQTDIKLCIANYTELFEAFWDAGLRMKLAKTEVKYDYSKLHSKVKIIVEYFVDQGYCPAVGCGIAANIYYESKFKAGNSKNKGKYIGLLSWTGKRAEKMQKYVGKKWEKEFSKQLEYLNLEIETSYKTSFKQYVLELDHLEATAQVSTLYFAHALKGLAFDSEEAFIRQQKAVEYFNQIVRKVTYSSGNLTAGNSNFDSNGITFSGSDSTASASQKAIVSKALSGTVPGRSGWCLEWVNKVYTAAGYSASILWSSLAIDVWRGREAQTSFGTDMTSIPLGACIITTGSGSGGAGHIGIYIGNGNVISEVGAYTQRTETIANFGSWAIDYIDGMQGMCGWVCPNCGVTWQ